MRDEGQCPERQGGWEGFSKGEGWGMREVLISTDCEDMFCEEKLVIWLLSFLLGQALDWLLSGINGRKWEWALWSTGLARLETMEILS